MDNGCNDNADTNLSTYEQFKLVRRHLHESANFEENARQNYQSTIRSHSKRYIKHVCRSMLVYLLTRTKRYCTALAPECAVDETDINRLLSKYTVPKRIKKRKLKPLIKHALYWLRFEANLTVEIAVIRWMKNNKQWLEENKTNILESCNDAEKAQLKRITRLIELIDLTNVISKEFGPRKKEETHE